MYIPGKFSDKRLASANMGSASTTSFITKRPTEIVDRKIIATQT